MSDSNAVKKSYNMLLDLSAMGQKNWCYVIYGILKEVNMEELWEAQSCSTRDLSLAQNKLYNIFRDNCISDINNVNKFPKLRTYKDFKVSFEAEDYLYDIKNISHVRFLAKFRLSSHSLRIETGRYERPKIPAEQRLCLLCKSGDVEDEAHFLLKCSLYENHRIDMLEVCNTEIENLGRLDIPEKFNLIMSCQNTNVLHSVGRFVFNSFRKRQETLENEGAQCDS